MATFLNVIDILGSLGFYSYVFPFILMLVLSYGILTVWKPFGDNQTVNVLVSLVTAFLVISFSGAVSFLNMFMPFMMIVLVVMLLVLMVARFGGIKEDSLKALFSHPIGYGAVIGIVMFVAVISLIYTQSWIFDTLTPISEDELSPEGFPLTAEAQTKQAVQTLLNPTIVGIVIMFIVFAIAAYMVTRVEGKG